MRVVARKGCRAKEISISVSQEILAGNRVQEDNVFAMKWLGSCIIVVGVHNQCSICINKLADVNTSLSKIEEIYLIDLIVNVVHASRDRALSYTVDLV